jgi:hypothetical protein
MNTRTGGEFTMTSIRGVIFGAVASVAIAPAASLGAQNKLDADALKLYGGTYSSDCRNPKATRLTVAADGLLVDEQGRRMTGRNVQAAYAFFGQSAPPEFQVALLSEVQGSQLIFIIFRDNSGQYVRLNGEPKVEAALGKTLLGRKYLTCEARRAEVPKAPPAAYPATKWHTPSDFLKDPLFKTVYYKALGAKAKERWLAEMDGPAPEVKNVTFGGVEYAMGAVCKPRDCGDNNMVLLYSAAQGAVYAKIFEGGRRSTLIGAPPPVIAAELDRLWAQEWRQQR